MITINRYKAYIRFLLSKNALDPGRTILLSEIPNNSSAYFKKLVMINLVIICKDRCYLANDWESRFYKFIASRLVVLFIIVGIGLAALYIIKMR